MAEPLPSPRAVLLLLVLALLRLPPAISAVNLVTPPSLARVTLWLLINLPPLVKTRGIRVIILLRTYGLLAREMTFLEVKRVQVLALDETLSQTVRASDCSATTETVSENSDSKSQRRGSLQGESLSRGLLWCVAFCGTAAASERQKHAWSARK